MVPDLRIRESRLSPGFFLCESPRVQHAGALCEPEAVRFQFIIAKQHFTGGLHAKPLFISRRAILHFQIIATIFSCEPRAEGRSTLRFALCALH
jgi:hypothetical protein